MSKKKEPVPVAVVPAEPFTEVWAVTTYSAECHDYERGCDGGEGTAVIGLFGSEQTARQFADKKNGGREYGAYRAQKLPVHNSMRNVY